MKAQTAFPSFRPASMPATVGLIAALAVAFVAGWFPEAGAQLAKAMAFDGTLSRPWTLVTYPFVLLGGQVFFFLFLCLWLAIIGQQLEPKLGSLRMVGAFLIFALAGSLALLFVQAPLMGPALPVAGLTVLWCALEPMKTIMFMFVLPLQARWLAVLTAVFVFFGAGPGNVLVGALSLVPLALGWLGAKWLATGGNQPKLAQTGRGAAKSPVEFEAYMEKVRQKEQERQEQERLRKLLEGGEPPIGPK
ncbi:MAG: rhomboid family intramembrane serine protease [Fimbriimonadaceae bacterium]|nr:rhomboid family intramembrane serine protease [Fimbriimonadaceae bacterium]QYK58161.1 MAG: rhomboid family intramembrane serine protease [Fimbriimonadaceae bacterium]